MTNKLTIKDFTTIKIPADDDDPTITIVTWAELELKMGKREFKKLQKWMVGQGCVKAGIYQWGLERYLAGCDSFRY